MTNDNFAKSAMRPVLDVHNIRLRSPPEVQEDSFCMTGNPPRCKDTLTPVDLFNFLEPSEVVFGQLSEEGDREAGETPNLFYTSYDYSLLLGPGFCSPVWLPMLPIGMDAR